jgi:hypothetical protein
MKLTANEIRLKDTVAMEDFIKSMSHDTRMNVVVWGLECLTVEQVIEALTDSVSDLDLRAIADHINTLDLECDPVPPEADPKSVHYGYSEVDEHQLVADMLAEAKARKGGA